MFYLQYNYRLIKTLLQLPTVKYHKIKYDGKRQRDKQQKSQKLC